MKEYKFKVGDRVHVVDDKDIYYGQTGVVIRVTDKEPMYRIQLDDVGKGWEYEKDLEMVSTPKHSPGDRFVIEVESVLTGDDGKPLYKIKGFNALVFDDNGLDRLRREEDAEAQKFTAKKRELVDRYIDEIKSIRSQSASLDINITLLLQMLKEERDG